MKDGRKFGKCDECGRLDHLHVGFMVEVDMYVRFCDECLHVFSGENAKYSSYVTRCHKERPEEERTQPAKSH